MKDLRGSQAKTVIKGEGSRDTMQTTDGQNIVTHSRYEQTKGASGTAIVTSTGSQDSKKESGHTNNN